MPYKETEFGSFVGFEPLTLCPIDTRLIDLTMMTPVEIEWLNNYHHMVAELLLPLLDNEGDRQWLQNATKKL